MHITILARAEPGPDESFDDAIGQVAAGLRKGGHRISILGIQCQIGKLISGLKRRQPDLVFNLIGQPQDDGPCGFTVMGLMDLLGLPYTGGGPAESMCQSEPSIMRALLGEGPVPSLSNGKNGGTHAGPVGLRLSRGKIQSSSVSEDFRAFHVGILGNGEPTAFPPIEIDASTAEVGCRSSDDTATFLSDEMRCNVEQAAQDACQPLRVRDYALMDVRVDCDGHARVASVNPQCDLAQSGDYARSAATAGVDHVQLVNRIAELAYERAERRQLTRLI
jgi:D-alanine-D-alanine ligase